MPRTKDRYVYSSYFYKEKKEELLKTDPWDWFRRSSLTVTMFIITLHQMSIVNISDENVDSFGDDAKDFVRKMHETQQDTVLDELS